MRDLIRVYFANDSDLADAGGSVTLEAARELMSTMTDRAKIAADQAIAVDERLTAMNSGSAAIQERRSKLRNEHRESTIKAFDTAILEYDTVDHEGRAIEYSQAVANIAWLSNVLTHYDNVTLPKLRLEHWRADAEMMREAGGMAMAQALEAAVKRHEALKNLLEVDGAATITASGKAHDLLVKALEYYRRAAETDAVADAEEKRQQMLEVLN